MFSCFARTDARPFPRHSLIRWKGKKTLPMPENRGRPRSEFITTYLTLIYSHFDQPITAAESCAGTDRASHTPDTPM